MYMHALTRSPNTLAHTPTRHTGKGCWGAECEPGDQGRGHRAVIPARRRHGHLLPGLCVYVSVRVLALSLAPSLARAHGDNLKDLM